MPKKNAVADGSHNKRPKKKKKNSRKCLSNIPEPI